MNTSGAVNNNNANNTNGVVPDCDKRLLKVAERPNPCRRAGRDGPTSKEGTKAGDGGDFQQSVRLVTPAIFMTEHTYYERAIAFDALYAAMKKSCRNVRWKDSVVGYEFNGLENTLKLRNRLLDGSYQISAYQMFRVHEPKERSIVASRLVDRQFQRSLCDNGLYEDITEHFIRDNTACQIGRGTDDAISRLKYQLRRYYRQHGMDGWALKCDIRHFFPETRHDVAKEAIRKLVSDREAADAVCKVIDSFDGDKGIGLGSQISQLVELAVLNDLDHFIKEQLHIRVYERYMDDFVLVHPDRDYLRLCKERVRKRLAGIGLELNKKTSIFPLQQGIWFLQWKFVLTKTGKTLVLMNRRKVTKCKMRLKKLWIKELAGTVKPGTTQRSFEAFLANAARGNTYRIRTQMKKYYSELTGGKSNDTQGKVA